MPPPSKSPEDRHSVSLTIKVTPPVDRAIRALIDPLDPRDSINRRVCAAIERDPEIVAMMAKLRESAR